jgi:2-polyprenyl-3-methyl-5-hydroxy-6-metoxy-1,4-benzoquinol methylase
VTTTITNERTSGFFDGYAGDFDAIYGTSNTLVNRLVNRWLRKSMRLRFERTLAGCDPIEGRTAIDIGCGPGHYAVALARRGAARVHGLDFAESMIQIAKRHAEQAGVAERCDFDFGDFLAWKAPRSYDYAVVMGFMDYMADPRAVIEKTLSMTAGRAFFSFPTAGGLLAWQRRLRYKKRCDLYLYRREQLERLFDGAGADRIAIDRIARDFFVTATMAQP